MLQLDYEAAAIAIAVEVQSTPTYLSAETWKSRYLHLVQSYEMKFHPHAVLKKKISEMVSSFASLASFVNHRDWVCSPPPGHITTEITTSGTFDADVVNISISSENTDKELCFSLYVSNKRAKVAVAHEITIEKGLLDTRDVGDSSRVISSSLNDSSSVQISNSESVQVRFSVSSELPSVLPSETETEDAQPHVPYFHIKDTASKMFSPTVSR